MKFREEYNDKLLYLTHFIYRFNSSVGSYSFGDSLHAIILIFNKRNIVNIIFKEKCIFNF